MAERIFITTQKKLAKAIGKTPEHLSNFKARRVGWSEAMVDDLHRITGIKRYVLVRAPTEELNKALCKFFAEQLKEKIAST